MYKLGKRFTLFVSVSSMCQSYSFYHQAVFSLTVSLLFLLCFCIRCLCSIKVTTLTISSQRSRLHKICSNTHLSFWFIWQTDALLLILNFRKILKFLTFFIVCFLCLVKRGKLSQKVFNQCIKWQKIFCIFFNVFWNGVCIYLTPVQRVEYNIRSLFTQSTAGLNKSFLSRGPFVLPKQTNSVCIITECLKVLYTG